MFFTDLATNPATDLASYQFELPESLIASRPVEPRDASRLFVLHRREQRWEHRLFTDLPDYLDSRDLLVLNNTQVLKARMRGHRFAEGKLFGAVEFVLLEKRGPETSVSSASTGPFIWEGLFHASAKGKAGFEFKIATPDGQGLLGRIIRPASESPSGTVVVQFNRDPLNSGAGVIPLPHYMNREADERDEASYQTVYAKNLGSAAAPTAGLHFTPQIISKIREKNSQFEELTLHAGLGTFRPVKVQDIREHPMHEEKCIISPSASEKITHWKSQGKRVLAVGTTSVRTLESAWSNESASLKSGEHRTSLFIRPGAFEFQVTDRLLTNFHLPGSTLLMLVSTFAGHEFTMKAYREAVQEKYRFFSYGDAMLIL